MLDFLLSQMDYKLKVNARRWVNAGFGATEARLCCEDFGVCAAAGSRLRPAAAAQARANGPTAIPIFIDSRLLAA
jgi:hypothetical protein